MIRMLDELWHKPSPRKLRLFGLASCARIDGLGKDRALRKAIDLARKMTTGGARPKDIDRTRERLVEKLETLQSNSHKYEGAEYRRRHWMTKAVLNLFQADEDYLNDAPIYPNNPVLKDVYDAVSYVLHDAPYGSDIDAHLLREVLGNPFHPAEIPSEFKTHAVLKLARNLYDKEAFGRMPELADLLEAAGCEDQRVLAHCRQQCEHVRGCWVIDELLDLDPKPSKEDYSWDYTLQHPSIDEDVLKKRLSEFGFRADSDGAIDDAQALEFADWLEANGDPDWANYIRTRCRLDDRAPGKNYPDDIEAWIEAGDRMHILREQFEGFYYSGYRFAAPAWWDNRSGADPLIRGLPTVVDSVPPGDGPRPIELVARQWQSLVQCTSIRGIDIEGNYVHDFGKFLHSVPLGSLRCLKFYSTWEDGQEGPLDALIRSPHAAWIERLEVEAPLTGKQVEALTGADFPRLRYLLLPSLPDVAEPIDRLMQADWFRRIEFLYMDLWHNEYPNALQYLAGMGHLHSLALFRPDAAQLEALSDPCELPALRRLDITGEFTSLPIAPIGGILAPLIELDLRCEVDHDTLASVLASPLCKDLRVFFVEGPKIDADGFDILASSPSAPQLRSLRLYCNGLSSLADSPLSRGAFPKLTTLDLRNAYSETATPDTATFLSRLQQPQLRHLNLEECATNDECAQIIGTSPNFAKLRRVTIRCWDERQEWRMSTQAAAELENSPNLKDAFVNVKIL